MKGSGVSALALALSLLALVFSLSGVILPTSSIVAGDWQEIALANGEAFTVPMGKTYECFIYTGTNINGTFTGVVLDHNDGHICYGKVQGWYPAYFTVRFNYDMAQVVYEYGCRSSQGWILTGGEQLKPSFAFTKIYVRWRDLEG
jgi:hypothetical protein